MYAVNQEDRELDRELALVVDELDPNVMYQWACCRIFKCVPQLLNNCIFNRVNNNCAILIGYFLYILSTPSNITFLLLFLVQMFQQDSYLCAGTDVWALIFLLWFVSFLSSVVYLCTCSRRLMDSPITVTRLMIFYIMFTAGLGACFQTAYLSGAYDTCSYSTPFFVLVVFNFFISIMQLAILLAYYRMYGFENQEIEMMAGPSRIQIQEMVAETIPKGIVVEPVRDETCGICLEAFVVDDEYYLVPDCNHRFHVSCLQNWLHMRTCPMCRHAF